MNQIAQSNILICTRKKSDEVFNITKKVTPELLKQYDLCGKSQKYTLGAISVTFAQGILEIFGQKIIRALSATQVKEVCSNGIVDFLDKLPTKNLVVAGFPRNDHQSLFEDRDCAALRAVPEGYRFAYSDP